MTKLKARDLQMVLRALIERAPARRDRALMTNIEVQMRAVREVRSRGGRPAAMARSTRSGARASGRRT